MNIQILSLKVLSHMPYFRYQWSLITVQHGFLRWCLHGLLKDIVPPVDLTFRQTIITKNRLYHSKSFQCGLIEFHHTKFDDNLLFQRTLHYFIAGDVANFRQSFLAIVCSNERCIIACRVDGNEFHGKVCPYSPGSRRRLSDYAFES